MDFNQFISRFLGQDTFNLFFKVFGVVFALLYIVYALVIYKQTQVMTRTLETKSGPLILTISLIQIFLGVILLGISLLIL